MTKGLVVNGQTVEPVRPQLAREAGSLRGLRSRPVRKDGDMAHVSTTDLDLHTAVPFGIARWSHSTFANYVVQLRAGEHVGTGEAAPNGRYDEGRAEGTALLAELAPEIADLLGPAGVEAYCDGLAGPAPGSAWPALRAGLSAAAWELAGKQTGEPVWRMLGLQRPSVTTSYTIAIGAPERMV